MLVCLTYTGKDENIMIKKVQSPTPYFMRGVLLAILENIVYVIAIMLGLAILLLMDGEGGGLHKTIMHNRFLNSFSESVLSWRGFLGQYPTIVFIIMLIVSSIFIHSKLSMIKANLMKDAGPMKSYAVMGIVLMSIFTIGLLYWSVGRGIVY